MEPSQGAVQTLWAPSFCNPSQPSCSMSQTSSPINFDVIESKTRELCQIIVEQAGFQTVFEKLSAFMADEGLKFQYQSINDLGGLLQQKQNAGLDLTEEEITQFEKLRNGFLSNPLSRGFLEAQDEVQRIQSAIHRQLSKTFDLGRVPTEEDFQNDCCSSTGCGC